MGIKPRTPIFIMRGDQMDALPGTSANAHVTFPPWRNHHHLPPFPADLNHNLTPASLSPCPSSAPTSFLAFMPLGRCVVRLLLSSVRRDANHQSSRGFCRPLMDRCGQSVHQCLPAGTVRIVGTLAVSSPPDFKCPLLSGFLIPFALISQIIITIIL